MVFDVFRQRYRTAPDVPCVSSTQTGAERELPRRVRGSGGFGSDPDLDIPVQQRWHPTRTHTQEHTQTTTLKTENARARAPTHLIRSPRSGRLDPVEAHHATDVWRLGGSGVIGVGAGRRKREDNTPGL